MNPFARLPVFRFARSPVGPCDGPNRLNRPHGGTGGCLLPPTSCRLSLRGQSLVEYAVLVAAVAAALVIMSDYVRRAFNAHAKAIEEELNGATQ